MHDEAEPSMQPIHEKEQPLVDEEVHSPQSDKVTTLCDSFIALLKDVDKPLYIGCETYTSIVTSC